MKKAIHLMLACGALLIQNPEVFGQGDTLYFVNEGQQFVQEQAAAYKLERKKTGAKQWVVASFQKKDAQWDFNYNSEIDQTNDSTYVETKHLVPNKEGYKTTYVLRPVQGGFDVRQTGKTVSKGRSLTFFPFRKQGTWTDYDSLSGRKLQEEEYENGFYTERNKVFLENGEVIENVFTFAEIEPRFRYREQDLGQFIGQILVYPQDAIHAYAEGKVFVTFVILTDGSLKDVRLLKGIFKSCDEEALRVAVATSGKWQPGVKNGKPVNVRMTIPIAYRLTRSGK